MSPDRRERRGADAAPDGVPAGGPAGPRRPARPATGDAAPGRGENRPGSSLVHSAKESTPSLRLRYDDIQRGFLYRPVLSRYSTVESQYGCRSTRRLTPRAARKIKGAAIKAHAVGFSLVTFMTFTCAPEDRERIATGGLVLGREMRRTLNAMQQRFRREGQESFAYVWVAENPGDDNPHVHLLTNLRVPRRKFAELATWIESLWGHGWVKIERIRKPESAGRYILKAVGYTLKGEGGTQGTVQGNRYGISRNIAVVEDTFELGEEYELASQALVTLTGTLAEGEDVERIADGLYLTRFGLAFGPGTDLHKIGQLLELLAEGTLPG
ncbi:MAG: rolling circle replication-associated protein [Coriobacteriia bacterium]